MKNKYSLKSFSLAVNQLAHEEANQINNTSSSPFKAIHYDFPESMLKYYFELGMSPRQTILGMNAEAEMESEFEAIAS